MWQKTAPITEVYINICKFFDVFFSKNKKRVDR